MLNHFSYYLVIVMKIFLVIVIVLVIVTKISLWGGAVSHSTPTRGSRERFKLPAGYGAEPWSPNGFLAF